MKDRLITLLTALAALGLAIFLLAPPKPGAQRPVSLPTSEDRGSDGLKGLYAWLQREKIAVASLRSRYDTLARFTRSPQGNVLLVSMPARKEIAKPEWRALRQWIAAGNSLLVLGAAYHRPDWADAGSCFCDMKKLLRDFSWSLDEETVSPPPEQDAQETRGETFKAKVAAMQAEVKAQIPLVDHLLAVSGQPLLAGVERLETQTVPRLLDKTWLLKTENADNLALNLLERSDGEAIAFWQIKAGEGQILLSLAPDLFSNTRLGCADNARFFANLLGQALAKDGNVIFDDYHFGLSELYDPEHFFNDPRLHRTLFWLGLLWLLYVIGYSDRLAPVRAPPAKLSAGDFIDAMAGFFARRVNKRALAAELVGRLLLDLRLNRQLRDETQAWSWLEKHPRIPPAQLALLKRAQAQRRVSLTRLADSITHIRTVAL